MDPVTGALLGSIGSSLLGGLFGKSSQSSANKANIQLNRENRDWMENMSNTSYQRAVDDLKGAGLNPMLAYSQGGANTPNNSAATVQPEDAVARSVSSAGDKIMQTLVLEQQKANIELTRANTLKTTEEAKTAGVTSANAGAVQAQALANARAEYRRILESENLTIAQRSQIEDMLPGMVKQQTEVLELTKAQTTSARAEGRLKEADIPSAEAAAKMWKEMAGGNVDQGVILKLILAIRSVFK